MSTDSLPWVALALCVLVHHCGEVHLDSVTTQLMETDVRTIIRQYMYC